MQDTPALFVRQLDGRQPERKRPERSACFQNGHLESALQFFGNGRAARTAPHHDRAFHPHLSR